VSKKIHFCVLLCLFILVVLFVGMEIIARLEHYGPSRRSRSSQKESIMFKSDPVLGWIAKPGKYLVPAYVSGGSPIQYTYLEDSSRATSNSLMAGKYSIILLGCSFTQGKAVSDSETFGWKLQEQFPSLKVGNFGMGAYGTFQSLLLLRRFFKRGVHPRFVVYGFCPFHEARNIASAHWLLSLAGPANDGRVSIPYCSLDGNGKLVEHAAIQWPVIPLFFREHFALPQLLFSFYTRFKTDEYHRRQNQRKITKKLLLEMRNLTESNDAKLIVVILSGRDKDRKYYFDFLKNHKIDVLDASLDLIGEYAVPGDGHPSGKTHSRWADEIAQYLKMRMPSISGATHA